LGSGSGTRNRPMAPGESGPCCQDNPTSLSFAVELIECYAVKKKAVNAAI
jgi:hypothetical protein